MDAWVFFTQMALCISISLLVMASLHRPLRGLLFDLCGTATRADFWTRYTQLMLLLGPLLSVTLFAEVKYTPVVDFALLKSSFTCTLFGLFMALAVVGWQLARFAQRSSASEKALSPE